ncbi:hypothetical protein QUF70_22010 [Desulfobacterales bacterium HSG17]|nr:hypothetical protein [Desulfobacterales bacterium HSG17]
MGWQLAGEFQFPVSHLFIAEPEILASQLEAVPISGKELVLKGEISKAVLEKANSEYINDPKTTLHDMTQMILKMRKNNQTISTNTTNMLS